MGPGAGTFAAEPREMSPERPERPLVALSHHRRVAVSVGHDDCCQAPLLRHTPNLAVWFSVRR